MCSARSLVSLNRPQISRSLNGCVIMLLTAFIVLTGLLVGRRAEASQVGQTLKLTPSTVIGGAKAVAVVTLPQSAPTAGEIIPIKAGEANLFTNLPSTIKIGANAKTKAFSFVTSKVKAKTSTYLTIKVAGKIVRSELIILPAPTNDVASRLNNTENEAAPASSGNSSPFANSAAASPGIGTAGGASRLSAGATRKGTNASARNVRPAVLSSGGMVSSSSTLPTTTSPTNPPPATGVTTSVVSLQGITLPTAADGGTTFNAAILLGGAAPSGGQKVYLFSQNQKIASVPKSVTVPAGATTVNVPVSTSIVLKNVPVIIGAYYGTWIRYATLAVYPPGLAPVNASTLLKSRTFAHPDWYVTNPSGGASYPLFTFNTAATGTQPYVTSGGTPGVASYVFAGYTNANAVGYLLFSSEANGTGYFDYNTSPTGGASTSLLSATFSGLTLYGGVNPSVGFISYSDTYTGGSNLAIMGWPVGGQGTFGLVMSGVSPVNPPSNPEYVYSYGMSFSCTALSSLSLNPTVVVGGNTSTGTVSLTGESSTATVISLSSSLSGVVVPASVTVPAWSTTATFPITTTSAPTGATATISATLAGVTDTATLTVDQTCIPPTLQSLSLASNSVAGLGTDVATVTLSGPALAGGQVITLSSSNSFSASVPYTVTVPAGQSSATFSVLTTPEQTAQSATITASYHGTVETQTLSVAAGTNPGGPAQLTSQGLAQGFSLTTVIAGLPNDNNGIYTEGPLGIVLNNIGGLLFYDAQTGEIYELPSDSDGQVFTSNIPYVPAYFGVNGSTDFAIVNGSLYSNEGHNDLFKLNPTTGAETQELETDLPNIGTLGLAVDPANNQIQLGGDLIDPSSLVITQDGANIDGDGVAVSLDGSKVYTAGYQAVYVYTITGPGTGAMNSIPVPGSPDGIALGEGELDNLLFVNCNSGSVYEINLATGSAPVQIMSGGSRGDWIGYGSRGSLLLSQSDRILRLTPPPGAGFGPVGRNIYTRDDLPHATSPTNPTFTYNYSGFSIANPALNGQSAQSAGFDLTDIAGQVVGADLERAGQLDFTYGGLFDLQLGVTSPGNGTPITSVGPVQESAQNLPTPSNYDSTWVLPSTFQTDIQNQLGGDYQPSFFDQVSGQCGPYTIADIPQENFPTQKDILTFLVAPTADQENLAEGRCTDITVPGTDQPAYGTWDIELNGSVIASSVQPNGWSVEADQTPFKGVWVTPPFNAAVTSGYEVRVDLSTALTGSSSFTVTAVGSSTTAAVLEPLTLGSSSLVGGNSGTATVSLDEPAPSYGAVIRLTSSNPSQLSVPSSVTIASGQTYATFTYTTSSVSSPVQPSVTAEYNGYRTASLWVVDTSDQIPSVPTTFTAVGGNGSITLTWNTVAGALTYTVQMQTSPGGPWITIFVGGGTGYTLSGLTNGSTYRFRISATNAYGPSSVSAPIVAAPVGGQVATPTISPNGGSFQGSVPVTLSDPTVSSVLYYTTDGSIPDQNSTLYAGQFTLTGNATVKAISYRSGWVTSEISSATFTVAPQKPIVPILMQCGEQESGSLTSGSPFSQVQGQGFYSGYYTFSGVAGQTVTVNASNCGFDPVLYLKNADGDALATSSGTSTSNTSAAITYVLPAAGTYTIEVTTFGIGQTGNYGLSLTCTGASQPPSLKILDPYGNPVTNGETVNLGTTVEGTPLDATFTIDNLGQSNLNIVSASTTSPFALLEPISSPISATQSTTFSVGFTPSILGTQSEALTIDSNDVANSPFTINLSGIGAALPVSPINCGSQISSTLTTVGTSTIRGSNYYATSYSFNTFSSETVTISVTQAAFVPVIYLLNSNGNTVAQATGSGGTATLTQSLTGSGTYTIQLTTNQSGATGTYTISLSCAAPPHLTVSLSGTALSSGTTDNFGTTTAGTPIVQTFTLGNSGMSDLTLNAPTVPSGFTLTQSPTTIIHPGATTTANVQLNATAGGTYSGALYFGSNDLSQNPFTVNVSGTVNNPPNAPAVLCGVQVTGDLVASDPPDVSEPFDYTEAQQYSFAGQAGETITVSASSSSSSPYIFVYSPSGALVDDGSSTLQMTLTQNGTWIVEVAAYYAYTNTNYNYTLNVTCTPPTSGPPAPPTGLTAAESGSNIALNWTVSGTPTGYTVYRSTTHGTGYTSLATGLTTTSYTDTTAAANTTYYYVVTETNSSGSSGYSNEASAEVVVLPATPAGLTAAEGDGQVKLTWSSVAAATSYILSRSTVPGGPYTSIASPIGTVYTDTSVTDGTTYYYVVAAVDSAGTSSNSSQVSAEPIAVPAVPTGLNATATSGTQINVSWTAVTGATSYVLQRAVSGGSWATVASPTSTTYSDTGLAANTTYFYTVSATASGVSSAYTNPVSATTNPSVPPAPTGLTAQPANQTVVLNWTLATGATMYTVERATSASGPFSTLTTTAYDGYTDTSVSYGTTYFYEVMSVNLGGTSAASNVVSATPVQATVAAPFINPLPYRFNGSASVTIGDATPGSTIYYTLNGTTPTASSSVYSAAINITATTTVEAIAVLTGEVNSPLASSTFTLNSPPTVSITAPTAGSSFLYGTSVPITATTSDSDGTIVNVEILVDGSPIANVSTPPYTTTWIGASGSHSVTAIATDNDDAQTTSSSVSFTVDTTSANIPFSCGQSVNSNLNSTTGQASSNPLGSYADIYTFSGVTGQTVTISMTSTTFNTNVTLVNPAGVSVAQNGTTNGAASNSQISFTLASTGTYEIIASSAVPGQTGPYNLSLSCAQSSTAPVISVTVNGSSYAANQTFNFGSTLIGVPVTASVNVKNSGTADLAITGFAGSGDFTELGAIGSPIAPNQSTSFSLRYNGTNTGTASGSLSLTNNSATTPFILNLTGNVPAPANITVTSLTFAPSAVNGGQSSTGTVTISPAAPSGGELLQISVPTGAPVQAPLTVTVPAGQTTVTFTAKTLPISHTANITIYAIIGPLSAPTSSTSSVLTVNSTGTPPTVQINAPAANATLALTTANTVSALANAQTTGATITQVAFFASSVSTGVNAQIGSASTSPYQISWTPTTAGAFTLTAVATDSNGLTTTSSGVAVTVAAGTLEPTPTISPASGTYSSDVLVSIADTDTKALIYYTTNGTAPSPTNGTRYVSSFYVGPSTSATTVSAVAYDSGYLPSNTASATYSVTPATVGANSPSVMISAPLDGAAVLQPTTVTGTITTGTNPVAYWVMDYESDSTSPGAATGWTVFAQGTGLSPSATFDPTLLLNGLYKIRLTAYDTAGTGKSAYVTVLVEGGQKVGYFTLSFSDMTVPIAGLPITITRTYDSRNKGAGDFGVGWTLSTTNVTLTQSDTMGADWEEVESGGGYEVEPTTAHIITVNLPDNTSYSFAEELNPNEQDYYPVEGGTVQFVALPGTHASLRAASPADAYLNETDGPTQLLDLDSDDDSVLARTEYILTLADGRQLDIDSSAGLKWIKDRLGNTTTFTSGGITTTTVSGGTTGVTINRSGNLITKITDPAGNAVTYTQDSNGNLSSTTDRDGNTTTFTYDASHDLTAIQDPRGAEPIVNVYNPTTGRLSSTTDAYGDTTTYSYNISGDTETITDPLEHVTTLTYDQWGNVLTKSQSLNGSNITTTSTFKDGNNPQKPTSVIDPMGRETDYAYDSNGDTLTTTQVHHIPNVTTPVDLTTTAAYNGYGQLLSTTDPLGIVTTNTYDAYGDLLSSADGLKNTTYYAYNLNGTVATVTDAEGNITTYGYDSEGDVTSVTDATNHVTKFTYDAMGRKLSQTTTRTNPLTHNTETVASQFAYDDNGNLVETTAPNLATSQTVYNSIGKVDHTIDPEGRITAYTYDNLGRETSTTYPDGTTSKTTYDADGNVYSTADRAGHVSVNKYDSLNRLTETDEYGTSATITGGVTNLTGATMLSYSKTTLDADGETVADVDGNGQTTSYIYDDLGRKISTTDALGNVVEQTTYDNDGREISSEDGNNHTTTSFYDNDGQLLNTTYPDGTQSSTTYDALGRRAATTDQAGLTTQYVYDNLGRLTSVATPLGNTETYTYDEIGEKLTQTDANGHTTSFVYDLNGRLVQKTLPLGMSMYQTYNLDGSLASVTDYNGNTVAMGYDSAGRLTGKYQGSLTGSQLASLTYNTDGSLHSKTKGSVTTTYAYDALGRTTSVTNANTGTSGLTTSVGYTFDSASNKLTQTSTYGSANTTVTYGYDADERLSQVTAPDSTVTKYAFDNAGNRASVVRPNGITTLYKYDTLNRLTDVVNQKTATGGIVSSYHYTLGPSGKRLDVTDQNGNVTAYTYDNDGRLVGESPAAAGNVVYGYDNVGNRTSKSVNGTATQTFTYDSNDRLTNSGYSYDSDGNLLSDPTNTYTWDWENKLTGTNVGRSNAATYVSDYDGIRVQQATSAGVTNYTIDPESGYGNVVEERGATGTLNARYDYGDDLVRMDRGSGVYYYIFDGLGSTRQLTDASGNVDNTDNYDAFGNIVSSTGSVVNPYLFDGQEQDGTGLYYLRARYVDPARGEFLGQDPYAGDDEDPISLHRYLYCGNDPVGYEDDSGWSFTPGFGRAIERVIQAEYALSYPTNSVSYGKWQYYGPSGWVPFVKGLKRGTYNYYKPDIFDMTFYQYGEIKPFTPSGIYSGSVQMSNYKGAYAPLFGVLTWNPPPTVRVWGSSYYVFNIGGVVYYTDDSSKAKVAVQAAATVVGLTAGAGLGVYAASLASAAVQRVITQIAASYGQYQITVMLRQGIAASNLDEEAEDSIDTLEEAF